MMLFKITGSNKNEYMRSMTKKKMDFYESESKLELIARYIINP